MTAAIGFDFIGKVRFLVKCLSENYLSNLRDGFQTGILIGMVSGEVAYFSDRLKNFDMLCAAQTTYEDSIAEQITMTALSYSGLTRVSCLSRYPRDDRVKPKHDKSGYF